MFLMQAPEKCHGLRAQVPGQALRSSYKHSQNPGAPNSPQYVISTYFRPQRRHSMCIYVYTYILGAIGRGTPRTPVNVLDGARDEYKRFTVFLRFDEVYRHFPKGPGSTIVCT